MSTNKKIRFSTWTLRHKRFASQVHVVTDVVVSGDDVSLIKNNSLYLNRVYRNLFGKGKWIKKREEDMYVVVKVELDDKIIGDVPFALQKEQVREQEDNLEWD